MDFLNPRPQTEEKLKMNVVQCQDSNKGCISLFFLKKFALLQII